MLLNWDKNHILILAFLFLISCIASFGTFFEFIQETGLAVALGCKLCLFSSSNRK